MKLYTLVFTVCITSSMFSQENANDVLQKHYESIGALKNIVSIKTVYAKAECTGPNGNYQTEIQSASDGKTKFKQSWQHKDDYIGIANGDTYWTEGKDLKLENGKTAFVWRSHEVQWIATHLSERFRQLTFIGYEVFGNKEAIKLSGLDEMNKTAFLYFDQNSALFLGYVITNPFSEKNEVISLNIIEWKKTDKILLPSNVEFTDISGKYSLNFHTIKINAINNSVFEVPPKIKALKELLKLHELQREAHFTRDAELLVSIMSDDFTEISKGNIKILKKHDLIKRFQAYFDVVTFIEWDDIVPPIIIVSDDITLAYLMVNKRVKLKNKDNEIETTIFAWNATFQCMKGEWKLTSITSTKAD